MKKWISFALALILAFGLAAPAFAGLDAAPVYETPYADSAFFSFGDYTLHYRVKQAEEAKGQIMMLHGFAESTFAWENLSELLVGAGYTCVLVDLPDFGYSSRETRDTEKLPREELIHALMTALSPEPWYLAGHSMGGYVALAVAETYPQSVRNLLLYGTSGNDGAPAFAKSIMSSAFLAELMGPLMELAGRSRLLVKLLLLAAVQDRDYVKNYDLDKMMDPFRIKGTGAGAIYNFSMLEKTDYDLVARMHPILFMNGDRDKVISDSARVNLRASLPQGSVDHIVAGGGHMFIENRADEAAAVTLAFLEANP